ncbi:MAG: Spy/CpxP family protein refolding chaperone [Thermoanaerobaculia bacterium]
MRRLALTALLLAGALPILAQGDIPDGKWWKRPRLAREIALTDKQSKQLDEIFVKARPRLIDLKAELEKKQFGLQQAIDEDADRGVLESRIDEVENARKDLQKTRALMVLDMKRVLTPEQWELLKQMREQLRERRRQMRENGASGRGPDRPPERP